ncbi:unnamed protein product [Adineta ricciae]|uniref:Sugar phosphate transporter domain-containing protein n=1 Tax=Adineta ricciae TaxID=249248 RepID=A0A815UZX6_ADIRI|nr:unnamed protein product [Adineta ricciae]
MYTNLVCFDDISQQNSNTIVVLIIYCVSGTFLTLLNKITVTLFPYANLLLIIQNTFAVVMLIFCSRYFRSTFGALPALNRTVLQLWMPLVFLFVLMLISSLSALIYVSVPTVIVMRNLTSLFVAFLEYMFLNHKTNRLSIFILLGMLGGAGLFAKHDFTFNVQGYIWLGVNIISTSVYQIYIKKVIHLAYFENIGSIGMSYYNNLLSLPVLGLIVCITGELGRLMVNFDLQHSQMILSISVILISSLLGFSLSISAFALNKLISATSMMVANNVNKFSVIVLSEILVKSTLDSIASIGAISVLFLGWLYSQTTTSTSKICFAILTITLIISAALIETKYIKTLRFDHDDYYKNFQPIMYNQTISYRYPMKAITSMKQRQGYDIYRAYLPRSSKAHRLTPQIEVRSVQDYPLPQNCRIRNASIWKTCDAHECQPYTGLINWDYPQKTIFGENTTEFINRILEIAWGTNPPSIDLYLRGGCHGIMEMKYLFESIELFWPRFLGSVIVVLDVGDEPILKYFLPQQPTHHYLVTFEHTPCLPGRVFNQYSYLNIDRHSSAEYIVTIDSDCAFHAPVTPDLIFRQEKIILPSSRSYQPDVWRRSLEAMMGAGMYDGHYMVTQPVTFARSTFSSFREWFYETKGICYEDHVAQLSTVHYQEFCWMCQVGSYLERGRAKKSDYDQYWYQHFDNESLEPMIRFAIHVPYEPFLSSAIQCREVICYEKSVNEIIRQGLCRAFGPSIFPVCMNNINFNYVNNVTFSYGQFEIQAANRSARIDALNQYLKRLARITMISLDD